MPEGADVDEKAQLAAEASWAQVGARTQALLGWGPAIIGAAAILWSAFASQTSFARSLVLPFGFLVALPFSIILHELSHFWMGHAVGLRPFFVKIGSGKSIFEKTIKGVTWQICAFPGSGLVAPYSIDASRFRYFVMIAAGPAANLLLLALAICTLRTMFHRGAEWFEMPLFQLAFINGGILFFTLLPFYESQGKTGPNDGQQLLNLLKAALSKSVNRIGGRSVPKTNQPTEASGPETAGSSANWQFRIDTLAAECAVAAIRYRLEHSGVDEAARLRALDEFATMVLMYGAPEYLAEADRYSKELYDATPDRITVHGTRGAVLVELGQVEEGMRLLLSNYENSPSNFDKGISAAYLALGELKRNQVDAAEEWLHKAKAADENSVPLKRIEKIIAARPR